MNRAILLVPKALVIHKWKIRFMYYYEIPALNLTIYFPFNFYPSCFYRCISFQRHMWFNKVVVDSLAFCYCWRARFAASLHFNSPSMFHSIFQFYCCQSEAWWWYRTLQHGQPSNQMFQKYLPCMLLKHRCEFVEDSDPEYYEWLRWMLELHLLYLCVLKALKQSETLTIYLSIAFHR